MKLLDIVKPQKHEKKKTLINQGVRIKKYIRFNAPLRDPRDQQKPSCCFWFLFISLIASYWLEACCASSYLLIHVLLTFFFLSLYVLHLRIFFFESVGVDCTNTILKHCVLSMMNYIHMDFDKPKLNRQAWFVVWLFRRGNIFSKRMMRNGEFSISGALKFCSDLLDKKKETFFNNFK